MNEKLAKMVIKGALGLVVSAAIGYSIKMEKKVQEQIDNYYEEKTEK